MPQITTPQKSILYNRLSELEQWEKRFADFEKKDYLCSKHQKRFLIMEQKIRLLPSGINDFEVIRRDNLYYVDKTKYISILESGDRYLFFGRPRRFGKSLFISMMEAYYDIKKKDRFDELFSGLWIHEHPTECRGAYQVMRLDFSLVNGGIDNVDDVKAKLKGMTFDSVCDFF